ncbi:HD family phosphohydrolase [candidate division KSB1 bacterium]
MALTGFQKFFNNLSSTRIGGRLGRILPKNLSHTYGIFLFVLLVVIATLLVPGDKTLQYADYRLGTIAKEEIIAPEMFPINKTTEEIDRERREARENIPAQFYRDRSAEEQAVANISLFFNQLGTYRTAFSELNNLQNRLSAATQPDSQLVRRINSLEYRLEAITGGFIQDNNIDIEADYWNFIRAMGNSGFTRFSANSTQILKDILAVGMVNVPKRRSVYEGIDLNLVDQDQSALRNIDEFIDNETVQEEISRRLQAFYSYPDTTTVGFEIIRNFVIPNIKYNAEETQRLRNEAERKVPLTRGYVQQNERIIAAHERITEEDYRKIESLRDYLTEKGILQNRFSQILISLGQAGILCVVLVFFVVYLYLYRPHILKDPHRLNMIFLIFLSQIVFLYVITQKFGFEYSEYLVPTTIGSMLLAVLFDGGVGFYGTIVLSFMAGGYLGLEYGIGIFAFAGGAAAVLSVRRIRTRSQFFRSIVYIFVAYAVVLYSIGIMRLMSLSEISLILVKYSLFNAVFSPLITLGFLAFFETVFNAATDMTLLELSDLNRPLLRELAIRAPGTYHHSIVLGNLSERAAEAIGANSLLARVGCYYHDIGKIVKPEYFIENQPDAKERHEALAPSMSALIISSHVRDGLDIAKKHKLPKSIHDFIVQHHGTSKISFFYEKAVEKSGAKYINESDFRYPGPKPQTKEAGIVMLADGVEAATRALKDPSPSRIKERVRSIVELKFQEEQLDECELTLKDLNAIMTSFTQIMTGIFHVRIEYPGAEKGDSSLTAEKIIEQSD